MNCSRPIRRESIIADLAEFSKSFDKVEAATVFGSLARLIERAIRDLGREDG